MNEINSSDQRNSNVRSASITSQNGSFTNGKKTKARRHRPGIHSNPSTDSKISLSLQNGGKIVTHLASATMQRSPSSARSRQADSRRNSLDNTVEITEAEAQMINDGVVLDDSYELDTDDELELCQKEPDPNEENEHLSKSASLHNRPSTLPPRNAWGQFAEHILHIDNDTMHFQMKPTSSKGSSTFKEVLEDIQAEINSKRRVRSSLKQTINVSITGINDSQVEREMDKSKTSVLNSMDSMEFRKTSTPVPMVTKGKGRQWKLARRDLGEQHLENKLIEDKNELNGISKTVTQLTDQERARQALYDRYLVHPTPWYEGLALFDKYKHLLDDKRKRGMRPATSLPMKRPGMRLSNKRRPMSAHSEGPDMFTSKGYL